MRASLQIEMLDVLSSRLHADEQWQLPTVPASDQMLHKNMSLQITYAFLLKAEFLKWICSQCSVKTVPVLGSLF